MKVGSFEYFSMLMKFKAVNCAACINDFGIVLYDCNQLLNTLHICNVKLTIFPFSYAPLSLIAFHTASHIIKFHRITISRLSFASNKGLFLVG